jgi:proteasome lid subunit RPN8/RPN11
MSDDIQFGDVEEAQPEKNLRPDRNRHFAVVKYGQPGERDLPVFVDLDVLLDMEAHAASDTSVELGGVMLGSHSHDDEGRPFVVVTDTLRAEHYESTKGSFKFTHETWEKISRQRDEFPPELQMVGWYHTHPDWGVFLSGMDHFICNNFFNKPLDVAYVIDPCRLDRSFFQWTGRKGENQRPMRGFYVIASRFRQLELEQTVQALEGKVPMPSYASGSSGSPIIHVQAPHQPPKPAWEGLAMMGMLAVQFCVLALIAWKMVGPPETSGTAEALAKLEKAVEARDETARLAERTERDLAVMDRIVGEMRDTSTGFVERYRAEIQRAQDMEKALQNSQAVQTQIEKNTAKTLQAMNDELQRQKLAQEKLEFALADLKTERKKLKDELKAGEETIASLKKQLDPDDKETADAGIFVWPPTNRTWMVAGICLAALGMLGTAFYWFRTQGVPPLDESLTDESLAGHEPRGLGRGEERLLKEPLPGETPPVVKPSDVPPKATEAAR